MPKRKRLPAAERRALIEAAALELFAERGYHGTAIDEIARRAGVSPPVLYDHFASKVALHQRLLERTRDELLQMWRDNLGGGGTRDSTRTNESCSRKEDCDSFAVFFCMAIRRQAGKKGYIRTFGFFGVTAGDRIVGCWGGMVGL